MHIHPHHKRLPAPVPAPAADDKDDDDDDDDDEPTKHTRTRTTRTSTTTSATKSTAATKPSAAAPANAAAGADTPSTPAVTLTSTRSSSTTKAPATKTKSSTTHKSSATKAISGTAAGAAASATPSVTNGLSSSSTHAIIGVVAAVAAVAGLAVILWFVRKWFLKKRAVKTTPWRASVHDRLENKRNTYTDAATSEKDAASLRPLMTDNLPGTPVTETFDSPRLPPPAGIPDSLRPSSVGSAAFSAPIVVPQSPSIAAMNATVAPAPQSPAGARREAAMVIRAFMPTLADELPVTIGETVFVIETYDDGWASCANSSGQCGVVPLECLQSMARKPHDQLQAQQAGDWRTSQRASSLYGGGRSSGTY